MVKQKACKICNTICETGDKCSNCGSSDFTDTFKGRIVVLDAEKSEIAKNLNLKQKGSLAIKTK